MSVGEVYLLDPKQVATYYGNDDELHLSFNFIALHGPWDAEHWNREIRAAQAAFDPVGAWPTWVLSNHDQTRHRQRYGGGERIARAAAVLLLGLRGTPFLYAGEELGLVDADVPREQQQDPQGRRDGCRAPIPWDATPTHGWQRADNWLPFPPEASTRNAATLRDDPSSILHLYRKLLDLRRSSAALRIGEMRVIDAPTGLVAWERTCGGRADGGRGQHDRRRRGIRPRRGVGRRDRFVRGRTSRVDTGSLRRHRARPERRRPGPDDLNRPRLYANSGTITT